jgi:hypothetical protein
MSKFKIRMKLQGLELEIDGSREDIPLITQNLGQQLSGLLQPAGAIIEGEVLEHASPRENIVLPPSVTLPQPNTKRRGKRKASSGTKPSVDGQKEEAVNWKHDSAKYGTPKQGWSTSNKAIWLLYVTGAEAQLSELSAQRITETFNKHFKQAGTILGFNVTRDLGRLKVKRGSSPPVGEDTTKTPSLWYLTDAGRKKAQELVGEALGQTD